MGILNRIGRPWLQSTFEHLGDRMPARLSLHLTRLEAEAITILHEVVAEFRAPVLLYSIGKDSNVLLHVARKAFYPGRLPFSVLHIDTTWKFRDMIAFRDRMAKKLDLQLIVHINEEGLALGINPFTSDSALYTQVMKTEGLKQALDRHGFDVAIGGARRDEEKSRAKERIFSVRGPNYSWDPRRQRPELWSLFNTKLHPKESIRVFPLSNWTELDVWEYILAENIQVVPLYFAAERPVVRRNDTLIMLDDQRLKPRPSEKVEIRKVRFRTLGCYPLTGAIESNATTVAEILQELKTSRTSERHGRLIDIDDTASMENKKSEGYF
jgi:sulfate adenylyltransferase subunit 2